MLARRSLHKSWDGEDIFVRFDVASKVDAVALKDAEANCARGFGGDFAASKKVQTSNFASFVI